MPRPVNGNSRVGNCGKQDLHESPNTVKAFTDLFIMTLPKSVGLPVFFESNDAVNQEIDRL